MRINPCDARARVARFPTGGGWYDVTLGFAVRFTPTERLGDVAYLTVDLVNYGRRPVAHVRRYLTGLELAAYLTTALRDEDGRCRLPWRRLERRVREQLVDWFGP